MSKKEKYRPPPNTLDSIQKVYDFFMRDAHDSYKAFDLTVEYLAHGYGLIGGEDTPDAKDKTTISLETRKKIHELKLFDPNCWYDNNPFYGHEMYGSDVLGGLATEINNLNKSTGQFLTPTEVRIMICMSSVGDTAKDEDGNDVKFETFHGNSFKEYQEFQKRNSEACKKMVPLRVCDPCCGFGGFLLDLFWLYPGVPMHLVGVEITLNTYRCAVIQMFVYHIMDPSKMFHVLCADALSTAVTGKAGYDNLMKYGNLWNPPHWSEMNRMVDEKIDDEIIDNKKLLEAPKEEPEAEDCEEVKDDQKDEAIEEHVKSEEYKPKTIPEQLRLI